MRFKEIVKSARKRASRELHSQSGFGTLELLLAAVLSMMVLGAGSGLAQIASSSLNSQQRTRASMKAFASASAGIDQMGRELRSAVTVVPVGRQSVDLQKCVDSTCSSNTWVRYYCDAGKCMRYQTAAGAPESALTHATDAAVVAGIENRSGYVFDFFRPDPTTGTLVENYASPTYMTVDVSGSGQVAGTTSESRSALSDGFALNNVPQPE